MTGQPTPTPPQLWVMLTLANLVWLLQAVCIQEHPAVTVQLLALGRRPQLGCSCLGQLLLLPARVPAAPRQTHRPLTPNPPPPESPNLPLEGHVGEETHHHSSQEGAVHGDDVLPHVLREGRDEGGGGGG